MKPILIVDDEAPIRALIRLTLERAGYTCDEAATGTEAADKIEANTYDLALLDIVDGAFVLREVAPGVSPDEVMRKTAGRLIVADDVREMRFS